MPQTTDLYRLNPHDYLEATFRNSGMATFDSDGNVTTKDGKPGLAARRFQTQRMELKYLLMRHCLGVGMMHPSTR